MFANSTHKNNHRLKTIGLILKSDQLRRQESYLWNDDQLEQGAKVWDEDLESIPADVLPFLWKRVRVELGPGEKLHPRHLLAAHDVHKRISAQPAMQTPGIARSDNSERRSLSPEQEARVLRELRETGCRIGRVPRCQCEEDYDCQSACDRIEDEVLDEETGETEAREFWICARGQCDFREEVKPLEPPRLRGPITGDGISPISDTMQNLARSGAIPTQSQAEGEAQHNAAPESNQTYQPIAATG